MDLGVVIWDFETNDFAEPLLKFFEHNLMEMNILYIHTIEILPEYRGMQIGEHTMKDAANNFEQGCSLIITDCLPLQPDIMFEAYRLLLPAKGIKAAHVPVPDEAEPEF